MSTTAQLNAFVRLAQTGTRPSSETCDQWPQAPELALAALKKGNRKKRVLHYHARAERAHDNVALFLH